MDRLSIVALAAVILKLACAPGFTDAGIPSGQEKKEREEVLRHDRKVGRGLSVG